MRKIKYEKKVTVDYGRDRTVICTKRGNKTMGLKWIAKGKDLEVVNKIVELIGMCEELSVIEVDTAGAGAAIFDRLEREFTKNTVLIRKK